LRLPEESHTDFLTERELGREHLDCYRSLEPLIAGMIDDTHAAAADLPVEREGRAKGLTQPLRQQIAHAVLQSIRGQKDTLRASSWQPSAALAALAGTD